jgi:dihydroorotase-like cyclic amidohydrolase
MITLPGLIDPHTHPRGLPTDDYREDFLSATQAALAGGFTTILDMPNNPKTPTLTAALLEEKKNIAKKLIVCDVGFFFGTNGKNLEEFTKVTKQSKGLKVFLSVSTGNLIIDLATFQKVCEAWPTTLPILLHAEEELIEQALQITKHTGHRTHICHVSSENELRQIIAAKNKGYKVTCGVTPHHLFLTEDELPRLKGYGMMKPPLKTKHDQEFLWNNLTAIDCIESDHAPHSKAEKEANPAAFGVTGLETTLPLLLTAVHEGKITMEDIIRLCNKGPADIFAIHQDEETTISIDENVQWTIRNENLFTKCKWSPFDGKQVTGKIRQVTIRGTQVFKDNTVLATPGRGKIL